MDSKFHEQIYKKPSSPVKTTNSILPENFSPGHVPRLTKAPLNYVEGSVYSLNPLLQVKKKKTCYQNLSRQFL